jgi:16S rRNA (cytosine967-C5)-methyltransferase
MIGALRDAGSDPAALFTGEGHAPAPLTQAELEAGGMPEGAAALDVPDWLWPHLQDALGDEAVAVAQILRDRAGLHLRVNLQKSTVAACRAALQADGVETVANPLSPTALEVTEGVRRLRQSAAYADGRVEIQDAASQAVADAVPLPPGARVLDYCAGGGGKTLALAGRVLADFAAHDADPGRLKDLPVRAVRAGVAVRLLDDATIDGEVPFDVVVADVPCSGSGAWRRQPEAKWRLTPAGLDALTHTQDGILDRCAGLVAPEGVLAYITCSLLLEENENRVKAFCSRSDDWGIVHQERLSPLRGGDGLFIAVMSRKG